MQFVILGLLLTGPLSLYDVRKRFRAGISLFYSASFGGIQRALDSLVGDGLVTISEADDTRRRRRLYAVTGQGRRRWREWMLTPIPDGVNAETLVLAKVFLLGRLESVPDRAAALDLIATQVASAVRSLRTLGAEVDAQAEDMAEEHRPVYAFQRATLDYGIRAHELMATWIDDLRAGQG